MKCVNPNYKSVTFNIIHVHIKGLAWKTFAMYMELLAAPQSSAKGPTCLQRIPRFAVRDIRTPDVHDACRHQDVPCNTLPLFLALPLKWCLVPSQNFA